ncbi:MAG: tetraacyldisaccharide 4'-kinase [Proteobacteria bacterium]|nr:tetraacyldisaccharide 4'-kinase [Pseudomonadota bacterium]
MKVVSAIQRSWQGISIVSALLTPLSLIYYLIITARRWAYKLGLLSVYHAPVPVVVVGNITVGGTGKTPIIIELARALQSRGWNPGIISRGYGVKLTQPIEVTPDSDPRKVGDEPVLISQQTRLPVVTYPDRALAIKTILSSKVDIILSDDGLQHFAMGRAVEISVVDGEFSYGNGLLLPAGPLREPRSRLNAFDIQIRRNGSAEAGEILVVSNLSRARNIVDGEQKDLGDFEGVSVVAVAGIHYPERFFNGLAAKSIQFETLAFSDHHRFTIGDLPSDRTVLMTTKDEVKCREFAQKSWWAVDQETILPDQLIENIERVIGQRIANG